MRKEGTIASHLQAGNHNRVPTPNSNGMEGTRSTQPRPPPRIANKELSKDNPVTHIQRKPPFRTYPPPYEIHCIEWRQTSGTYPSPLKRTPFVVSKIELPTSVGCHLRRVSLILSCLGTIHTPQELSDFSFLPRRRKDAHLSSPSCIGKRS